MTAVIEASSAGVKDMADGSLRITFEFEPRHAAEAFALFGPRGRAVAIAALKDGAAKVAEPEKPKERERMGDHCYRAVMWCNDPDFQDWIQVEFDKFMDGDGQGMDLIPDGFTPQEWARQSILTMCEASSRKDLDTNERCGTLFRRLIVTPWRRHQSARGVEIDQREHA